MKHAIRKALIATAIAAAMLAALVPTAAFAAETSTANEVNPGNYEYTITDATNVQKAIAKISTLTDEQEFLYDIDGSEGITISDATTIQKIVAKICDNPTYHEDVYETVEHPAEYETIEYPAEYETVTTQTWVVDQEAYTYEEPIYKYVTYWGCHGCGEDFTGWTQEQIYEHMDHHALRGWNWGTITTRVQTGSTTITVPEEGHYEDVTENVLVKEASTEQVLVKDAYTEEVLVKAAGWYCD